MLYLEESRENTGLFSLKFAIEKSLGILKVLFYRRIDNSVSLYLN